MPVSPSPAWLSLSPGCHSTRLGALGHCPRVSAPPWVSLSPSWVSLVTLSLHHPGCPWSLSPCPCTTLGVLGHCPHVPAPPLVSLSPGCSSTSLGVPVPILDQSGCPCVPISTLGVHGHLVPTHLHHPGCPWSPCPHVPAPVWVSLVTVLDQSGCPSTSCPHPSAPVRVSLCPNPQSGCSCLCLSPVWVSLVTLSPSSCSSLGVPIPILMSLCPHPAPPSVSLCPYPHPGCPSPCPAPVWVSPSPS